MAVTVSLVLYVARQAAQLRGRSRVRRELRPPAKRRASRDSVSGKEELGRQPFNASG